MRLKKGDKIKLLPTKELLELFEARNFFSVSFRKEAAERLGDKEGIVENIEEKYAKDYFFFLPDNSEDNNTWLIPYQSVKFFGVTNKNMIEYPTIGGVYQHYKGGLYEVITMANHSETNEPLVIYKSLLFGSIYARPLSMWFEQVVLSKDNEPFKSTKRFVLK